MQKKKREKEKATARKKEKNRPGLLETIFEGEKAQSVKYAKLGSCPGKTLEEMAEGFMGSHSWSSGKSEDGMVFVDLKGDISFMEKNVIAVIQFKFNDDDTFQFNALELNEIPQNNLIASSLLEKMCDATKE